MVYVQLYSVILTVFRYSTFKHGPGIEQVSSLKPLEIDIYLSKQFKALNSIAIYTSIRELKCYIPQSPQRYTAQPTKTVTAEKILNFLTCSGMGLDPGQCWSKEGNHR